MKYIIIIILYLSWEWNCDGVWPVRVNVAHGVGERLKFLHWDTIFVKENNESHRSHCAKGALSWDQEEFFLSGGFSDYGSRWRVTKATVRINKEPTVDSLLGNSEYNFSSFTSSLDLLHLSLGLKDKKNSKK